MADLRIFVECTTKAVFDARLAAGDITASQLVLIKSTNQIYHNGVFYGLSAEDAAKLAEVYARKEFGYISDGTNTYRATQAEDTMSFGASSTSGEVMSVSVGASGVQISLVAASGTTNGTISLNGTEVAVAGLGSAAFEDTTAFDAAGDADAAEAAAKGYADDITVNGVSQVNQAITIDGDDIDLTGYQKASSKAAVAATDSVNEGIGKLEHRLDNLDLGDATSASKADFLNSTAFTGTPTAPTAALGTDSTQIATTAFVKAEINDVIAAADALVYKGTVDSQNALPAVHTLGWTYIVAEAGTYAGQVCEVGDMIICNKTVGVGGTPADSDWNIVQTNVNGAVTGPASAVDAHVAIFNGATGKIIADSGFTIGKSVPADAEFTDTTYTFASGSDGSFTVTEEGGSAQTISIGKPATAGTADEVAHDLSITKGDGTTATFDGSADVSLSVLSNDILTGTTGHAYSKPQTVTAIADSDSIQAAIGKLEAMFDWVVYNSAPEP